MKLKKLLREKDDEIARLKQEIATLELKLLLAQITKIPQQQLPAPNWNPPLPPPWAGDPNFPWHPPYTTWHPPYTTCQVTFFADVDNKGCYA